MILKQYYLGCLAHASYLIADEITHHAAIVDPQRDIAFVRAARAAIGPNVDLMVDIGNGVRWDTAGLLTSTRFKCTGASTEVLKTATTTDKTVVLQADFYRAGNGGDESFTAQMIISDKEIAPNDFPGANMWVQGVGCGTGIVNFR